MTAAHFIAIALVVVVIDVVPAVVAVADVAAVVAVADVAAVVAVVDADIAAAMTVTHREHIVRGGMTVPRPGIVRFR